MSTPDNPQQSWSEQAGSVQPTASAGTAAGTASISAATASVGTASVGMSAGTASVGTASVSAATASLPSVLPGNVDQATPVDGVPSTGVNPPPWQRTPTAAANVSWAPATALIDAPTASLTADQLGMRLQPPWEHRDGAEEPRAPGAESATGAPGRRPPSAASVRPVRGRVPRRASLQIKRFDPWSVLRLALVLGVALFLVWMFAVGVLYAVLAGMGVWDKLNGTFAELTSASNGNGQLITAGGVFGVATVVGLITTVLFTALASISAFIYNVSADVAGGIEVTLSERD